MSNGDIFGAFNALLGYLGGEAATATIFDRFLWPQRHFSSCRPQSIPRLALLYSMSGPISSTALEVIDTAYANGLFNGANQGHMLGTGFYRDLEWTYILHALGDQPERESQIRNCIWVQALLGLPLPVEERIPEASMSRDIEAHGLKSEKKKPVRAKVAVSHLTLTKALPDDISNRELRLVSEHAGNVGVQTLIAISLTEASGIGVMIGVAIIKRSLWAIPFIVPLVLRLLGALLAVHREPLDDLPDSVNNEAHRDWEIQCPAAEGRFMLITGPPSVVNQFFRHYGHPVRNRLREIAQLLLIIAYGSLFPVGLLCQVLWMPTTIQYVWTIWQVYVVIAMHLDRYTQKGIWRSTTEARMGEVFAEEQRPCSGNQCKEATILFGHRRKRPGVVKATLNTTIASSYKQGKDIMHSWTHRHQKK